MWRLNLHPEEGAEELVLLVHLCPAHGFPIKGLACSGEPEPKELSEDGTMINIAGYQWNPQADEMKIMTPKLFIGKKKKG